MVWETITGFKNVSKKLNESADQNTFEFSSIFKLQNIAKIKFISILAGGGFKSGGTYTLGAYNRKYFFVYR